MATSDNNSRMNHVSSSPAMEVRFPTLFHAWHGPTLPLSCLKTLQVMVCHPPTRACSSWKKEDHPWDPWFAKRTKKRRAVLRRETSRWSLHASCEAERGKLTCRTFRQNWILPPANLVSQSDACNFMYEIEEKLSLWFQAVWGAQCQTKTARWDSCSSTQWETKKKTKVGRKVKLSPRLHAMRGGRMVMLKKSQSQWGKHRPCMKGPHWKKRQSLETSYFWRAFPCCSRQTGEPQQTAIGHLRPSRILRQSKEIPPRNSFDQSSEKFERSNKFMTRSVYVADIYVTQLLWSCRLHTQHFW